MESMSNAQAGHLKHLIFYFPQFVLKVHISTGNLTRLTYDYVADYGESASGPSVLKYDQMTTLVKGWIEFRLEILSSRCHSQRFARKDINRIAKLAFELVPRLHIWLLPHRFTDHSSHADGIAEHAWDCQECSWTREMLD
ncbi:hypothetical protein Slin15195_G040920 [Septoria linicola]|uniref:Uncharacterized protein n=1 Tax=Septoria linicola TaxID=215465 RepID=A0A9Q9ARC6_9PEZI|nr:hypothetical protein Slin14017_G044450 [Septoria linicola]USW50773.1 hypothetical protein Slin15195_G040920 [Septoria linicola]